MIFQKIKRKNNRRPKKTPPRAKGRSSREPCGNPLRSGRLRPPLKGSGCTPFVEFSFLSYSWCVRQCGECVYNQLERREREKPPTGERSQGCCCWRPRKRKKNRRQQEFHHSRDKSVLNRQSIGLDSFHRCVAIGDFVRTKQKHCHTFQSVRTIVSSVVVIF